MEPVTRQTASARYAELTRSAQALLNAIALLHKRAGVRIGEPFRTTRVALIVESQLKGITADCALYVLERDGFIARDGRPGKGTWITLLPAEAKV